MWFLKSTALLQKSDVCPRTANDSGRGDASARLPVVAAPGGYLNELSTDIEGDSIKAFREEKDPRGLRPGAPATRVSVQERCGGRPAVLATLVYPRGDSTAG